MIGKPLADEIQRIALPGILQFADGDPAPGGLSDLGRAAVVEMNRFGVIVDVAHSGWQTSLEAAQVSQQPIVASHTACDAVNHPIRAKPIEVIKAIVDGGGLAGICCIPSFLGGNGDIHALLVNFGHYPKVVYERIVM